MISHTFIINAYGESPYLEECIKSVMDQNIIDKIIMTTSTPNASICGLSEKYNIPLFINKSTGTLSNNWNFGIEQACTDFATLCHQDCVYGKEYSTYINSVLETSQKPLLIFTDYCELRNGEILEKNLLFTIRKVLSFPLRFKALRNKKAMKRLSLAFGPAICCPSVTFAKKNLETPIFRDNTIAPDWDAWERISKTKGDFVYINHPLMYNRIHKASNTTAAIDDNTL